MFTGTGSTSQGKKENLESREGKEREGSNTDAAPPWTRLQSYCLKTAFALNPSGQWSLAGGVSSIFCMKKSSPVGVNCLAQGQVAGVRGSADRLTPSEQLAALF